MQPFRWGILGTGNVAQVFARDLSFVPNAKIEAVGFRCEKRAEVFGQQFSIPNRYANYEAFAQHQEIDVVYIATPHVFHRDHMLLCLEAGKHVLCEKPFTLNSQQATEVIALARQKKKFLMEAMWTRFLPAFVKVREIVKDGMIGDIRLLMADFGVRWPFHPENRLFNPELGGGALLDLGVYPVSLASMLFGIPTEISGLAHLGETGIDEQSAMVLKYSGGQLAVLTSAVRTGTQREALICGTRGHIKIHAPFHGSSSLTIVESHNLEDRANEGSENDLFRRVRGRIRDYCKENPMLCRVYSDFRNMVRRMTYRNRSNEFFLPVIGKGMHYQAAEVARCLRSGKLESDIMPLDESLTIMKTLDQLRQQWGLKYPCE